MKSQQPDRRRGALVDPALQSRIVVGVTALPIVVLLVAAIAMWFLTQRLFDEAAVSNAELPSLGLLAMVQFLFVFLTGAAAILQALRYSHRVVGPSRRIAEALRRIRTNDIDSSIQLRKGDELQSILDELNPLIEELQARRPATTAGKQMDEPAPEEHGQGQPQVTPAEVTSRDD